MKRFLPFLLCGIAIAQPVSIPNSNGIAFRNAVNNWLAWLNANKASLAHVHLIPDITGLQGALDAKLPVNNPVVTGNLTVGTTVPAGGIGVTTLSATAPVSSPGLYGGAFRALMTTLAAGQSAAVQIIGDSTGAGTTRWPYLTAQWLAAKYPTYTVKHILWNDVNQNFDVPTVIQTGVAGERKAVFTGVRSALIPAGDAPGITGDVDIRLKVAPNTWRPAAGETCLLARFGNTGQIAFRFEIQGTTGNLYWNFSSDGTALVDALSTVGLPDLGANVAQWVRVTHQMNDGAAHNLVKFYTSSDGLAWVQLGATIQIAGATSIFNGAGLSAIQYEIGARGGTASPLTGWINNVQILSGINGYPIAPLSIDAWQPTDTSTTFFGAPELFVVNASMPGAGIDYWSNAQRILKATPNYGQVATIFNLGHNEGASTNSAYGNNMFVRFAALAALVKTQLPSTRIVVVNQNPRSLAAITGIREAAIRSGQLIGWATANGYGALDTYSAFLLDARGLAALVDSGGIHPTDAAGSPLWATVVTNAMLLDAAK